MCSSQSGEETSSSVAVPAPRPARARREDDKPLLKLTAHLLDTFNLINEVSSDSFLFSEFVWKSSVASPRVQRYYAAKRKRLSAERKAGREKKQLQHSSEPGGCDDADSNYIIMSVVPSADSQTHHLWIFRSHGEVLNEHYQVETTLGKGSFGRVVRAVDLRTNEPVAIKIVKSKHPFFVQAQVELKILAALQPGHEKWNIVRMLDQFMHRKHQCIVFELLSTNLFDLLQSTGFTGALLFRAGLSVADCVRSAGVSLNLITKFAKQLLQTLSFLQSRHGPEGKAVIHWFAFLGPYQRSLSLVLGSFAVI